MITLEKFQLVKGMIILLVIYEIAKNLKIKQNSSQC